MALRHARAAQKYATTTDSTGRAILVTIAMDIGHNDQPSYPSYRTIAERVGCHYNTVSSWVKQLAECGDLVVIKDGKRQKYSIPFINHDDELSQPEYDNDYDKDYHSDYHNDVTALSQRLDELSQQVEKLSQLVLNIVTAKSVTEEEVLEDTLEEEDYIYIAPDPEPIAELKTAIGIVTKTRPYGKNEKLYDEFAYELLGWEITPDKVRGFSGWWERNGHYAGKPALESMMNEWLNYAAGVEVKQPSPNGHLNGRTETGAEKYARIFGSGDQQIPDDLKDIIKR